MLISSLSGIRGVLNRDFTLADVARFSGNFAAAVGLQEVLVGRDTRGTGPAMAKAVGGAAMAAGKKVIDYGVVSTPALFRESRLRRAAGVMVTASHNEPEFNGLKFLVEGKGVGKETFEAVMGDGLGGQGFGGGSVRFGAKTTYSKDLVQMFGEGAYEGVNVALDLGGGAAASHAVGILRGLGCGVVSVNDAPGVFNRVVDPVADGLDVLRRMVVQDDCDIGLGFDCDGDRLAIVDSEGRKRTGDFMLTLALAEALRGSGERKLVVSVDTTQAIDAVARKAGAAVTRSRVGEANVVSAMVGDGARLGGEGSSGGLIDGAFNYCRDSMLAALVIIRALKREGVGVYKSVPAYHIERSTVKVRRSAVEKAMKRLAAKEKSLDLTDGVKVRLSERSWVLVRPSGTEDLVRVSAEAESGAKAVQIVKNYSKRLKELSS